MTQVHMSIGLSDDDLLLVIDVQNDFAPAARLRSPTAMPWWRSSIAH